MRVFAVLFAALISTSLLAAPFKVNSDLDYLPKDVSYNPDIPKPADVLGYPVGTWHVRHDQLVNYMYALAEASDRVEIIETGRTHEYRPLLQLRISTPQNLANLEQIRQAHLQRLESKTAADPDKDPLIIWMGYSVHGDEASGSNASMLVAYYLAAAQGEKIDALLNTNVVLLDPSINPDGLSRFAQWANMHRGSVLNADPNHREHEQHWPSGRTNHYWFDLNRDWLLLTHPESRARIKQFHHWRPHVLTDFHEMGTDSTYFFQPGIPSRKNPHTPNQNPELTAALGQFHAKALDREKRLYFTEEAFDDFYYGKGSTYPDAHGSIGILFEQASSRGHVQESVNGPVSFPFAIHNQLTTSLSTFEGALAIKPRLMSFMHQFTQDTDKLIADDDLAGFVVGEDKDTQRLQAMLGLLDKHQIEYFGLNRDVEVNDHNYSSANSYFVPLEQRQYRLIKSLFSTRQRFDDNTFYDVSNWNLPMSFNVQFDGVKKDIWRRVNREQANPNAHKFTANQLQPNAYAYAFSWEQYGAPRLLQQLLAEGVQVKLAGRAFNAETGQGRLSFEAGAVVIPAALEQPENLLARITALADANQIQVRTITSGLTAQGIDLGSRWMQALTAPKVLLVGGVGTSQYEAGETWHYLDKHVGMPVTIVDKDRLASTGLDDYTHIIFVEGRYNDLAKAITDKIANWVKAGGTLIGQKSASQWFSQQEWLATSFSDNATIDAAFKTADLNFADQEMLQGKQRIAGAAFAVNIDLTHPLAFGLHREQMPLFRNSSLVMQPSDKPFVNVAIYTADPLLAGYTSDELQKLIANSAAIVAHRVGNGRVIGFTDNLNFRGYWYGSSRLLSNAIFMSGFINAPG